MKKIFAFALAMVSTVSMFAAINSQFTLFLDTESKEVEARVACGDTYHPFNPASSAAYIPMYSNPSNIGLYFVYAGGYFMELNAPQLVNVPVVIVSSREESSKQTYTLYAELGDAANNSAKVYLTDLRAEGGAKIIEITNELEYTFSIADEAAYVEGENSIISDRFFLNFDAQYAVTTDEKGYATIAFDSDFEFMPAGLIAYKGQLIGSTLYLSEVNEVPANTGVIVIGAASTTYYFTPAAENTLPALEGNDLVATLVDIDITEAEETYYTLQNKLETVAFYPEEGTAIAAGSAYIVLNEESIPEVIEISFDAPTAVETVENGVKAEKMIENGRVLIRRGNAVYTLQGQVVK